MLDFGRGSIMDMKINKLPLAMMKVNYEDAIIIVRNSLILITAIALIQSYTVGYIYTVKILLIVITAVIVARETEILYLTHDKKIYRSEAKELIKQTHPMITGLIYALILPVGTPIYVVAIGAFISIFIGKMVFGGFTYNPFNSAIVGRLFITLSWPGSLTTSLNGGIVNFILQKFQNSESEILFSTLDQSTNFKDFLFHTNNFYGNIGDIGLVPLAIVFTYLVLKKVVNPINVVLPILLIFTILLIVSNNLQQTLELLLTNYILFSLIYLANDPITTPLSNYGRVIYSTIIGITGALIIYLGSTSSAIIFTILFANLFVALINSHTLKHKFSNKKSTLKLVIISTIAIIVTILAINSVSNGTDIIGGVL